MVVVPVANPPNPWASTDIDYLDGNVPATKLEVYEDHSRTILSKNDSPDLAFTWAVNPYRGCFHACAYCYARPTHEYLSFGAGTDFDRKIVVKPNAPKLLEEAFERRSWTGELVVFSGVTDCYQPVEASYRLTRACLEVCLAYKNPVAIITKSPLIERDVDLLVELATHTSLTVSVSIPFWNLEHVRAVEPYVATPARRMRTVRTLADRGIRVGVNVAPVIPGLSDEDIPDVLHAAREAGASFAGFMLLRLPGSVKSVFSDRIRAAFPQRSEKILRRIREAHGGELYDATFGKRGRGEGPYADAVKALFDRSMAKAGIARGAQWSDVTASTFTRPPKPGRGRQLPLF